MDVEGWELRALRGAEDSLQRGIVQAGFVEIAPSALELAGTRTSEVMEFLESVGFDLYFASMWDADDAHGLAWWRADIYGTSLRFARATPLPPTFGQGDILALHRSHEVAARVRAAGPRMG